jgi:hypothetical protein
MLFARNIYFFLLNRPRVSVKCRNMTDTLTAIAATVPRDVKDALRDIAHKNKRSLSMEIAWVLERYVRTQQEDGA